MNFNISSHICGYDITSSKFDIQGPALKVKVDMTEIFFIIWDIISSNLKSECLQYCTLMPRLYMTFTLRSQFFVSSFT